MCFDHPVSYICHRCEARILGGGYVRTLCPEGERTQRECQIPVLGAEELREARDLCSRCLNNTRNEARYQQPGPQEFESQHQPPPYQQQHQHGTRARSPSRERTRPRPQFDHSHHGDGNGGGSPLEEFDNLSLSDDRSLPPDRSMPARDRDDDLRQYRQDRQSQNHHDRAHTTLRGGGGERYAARPQGHWDNTDTNSIQSVSDYDHGRGRQLNPSRDYNTKDPRRHGREDNIGTRHRDTRDRYKWDYYDRDTDSLRPSSRSSCSGSTGWSRQTQGPYGIMRTTDEYGVPEVTVPVIPWAKIKKEGSRLVQVRHKKRSIFL
ncbi:hypothetical protein RBB50_007532 [Rhinocladiella similis]